jgi:hypothetical protein
MHYFIPFHVLNRFELNHVKKFWFSTNSPLSEINKYPFESGIQLFSSQAQQDNSISAFWGKEYQFILQSWHSSTVYHLEEIRLK